MSKFYVGQKVLVTGSSYYEGGSRGKECVGEVCEIKSVWGDDRKYGIYTPDKTDYWYFNASDLKPITETPETLTINGVEYIRKPEQVVEHEWKFGDVATHGEYGVGIVTRLADEDGDVYFDYAGDDKGGNGHFIKPSSLTFIRRADLSV